MHCDRGGDVNQDRNARVAHAQQKAEIDEIALHELAGDFIETGAKCTTCNKEKTCDVTQVVAHSSASERRVQDLLRRPEQDGRAAGHVDRVA